MGVLRVVSIGLEFVQHFLLVFLADLHDLGEVQRIRQVLERGSQGFIRLPLLSFVLCVALLFLEPFKQVLSLLLTAAVIAFYPQLVELLELREPLG